MKEWKENWWKYLLLLLNGLLIGSYATLAIREYKTPDDMPSERIHTELIDEGKYLLVYKTRVDGQTIYSSTIVDK